MKKKLLLTLILGLVVAISVSIGAYAATKYTLIVNGKVASAEVKVISGVSYVPLREVATILGAAVGYESKTQTITINSKAVDSIVNNPPALPAVGSSRKNAAKIGTTVNFKVDDMIDKYEGTLAVEQIIRGQEAWTMISQTNQFNSAAPEGYEYLLAKVNIKITKNSANSDAAVDVSPIHFTMVSTEGKDYERNFVVDPEPSIDTSLYEGASHTGWVSFLIETTDENPVIAYNRKYDGTGGVWFKTNAN